MESLGVLFVIDPPIVRLDETKKPSTTREWTFDMSCSYQDMLAVKNPNLHDACILSLNFKRCEDMQNVVHICY